MDKENFDLLMDSLGQAKAYAKGSPKKGTKEHRWEIAPVKEFNAKKVKRIRASSGLSQPDFADLLGVSVKTVRSWEQGISIPARSSARLLEALEKSRDKFLDMYKDMNVIRLAR